MSKNDKQDMTKSLYWHLLPVLILSNLISRTQFIDSLFVGQFLGADILASISLYNPINLFITGIDAAVVVGTKQECCKAIGNGDNTHLNRVFNTIFKCFMIFGVLMTSIMIIFRFNLASILGAKGDLNVGCGTYILGCALDVLPCLIFNLLLPFLVINGKDKRSYTIIGINLVIGLLGKYILLRFFNLGAISIGLANMIAHMICLLIMLPSYLDKKNLVHFASSNMNVNDIESVIYDGSPLLMDKAGNIVKNLIVNNVLMKSSGVTAVVVLTLDSALINVMTCISKGNGDTVHMLAGYYEGEGNRPALNKLFRLSIIAGLIIASIVLGIILFFQDSILSLYGISDPDTIAMAKKMLPLESFGLVLNVAMIVLIRMFQVSNKMTITNIISFLQTLLPGILTSLLVGTFGTDINWCTFSIVTAILIVVLVIYGLLGGKGSLKDVCVFLHLPSDFGIKEEDRITLTINDSKEVVEAADKVADFCLSKGAKKEIAKKATLFVEEMASNITDHGFRKMKNPHKGKVWVSAIYKNNNLTIRLRDNCLAFDPKEYLNLKQDDEYKALGIKLVTNMADAVVYQNVFGLNMLNIELKG